MADVYKPSERAYGGTPEDLDYGPMESRRVHQKGTIRYGGDLYDVSSALAGWSVGVSPRQDGLVEVWFSKLLVGHIDPATASFTPVRTDGRKAREAQVQQQQECNP